jgi:hypothetical protein
MRVECNCFVSNFFFGERDVSFYFLKGVRNM